MTDKATATATQDTTFRKWYILILAAMAACVGVSYKYIQWRVYIPCLAIASVVGWSWCILMEKLGAWYFPPESILGVKFGVLVLEDWIFSPVCFSFFYVVYRFVPRHFVGKEPFVTWIIIMINIFATVIHGWPGGLAGTSLAATMAIPAVVLMVVMRKSIDPYHYWIVFISLVAFSGAWDYAGTYFNMWQYKHDAFLYHPNLWIGANPLEITPWLGWAGAMLSYALIVTWERMAQHDR